MQIKQGLGHFPLRISSDAPWDAHCELLQPGITGSVHALQDLEEKVGKMKERSPQGNTLGAGGANWGILRSPLGPNWDWIEILGLGRCWMWAERGEMRSFPGSDNSKRAEGPLGGSKVSRSRGRAELAQSPFCPGMNSMQEETVSGCARGGLGWTSGKFLHGKACPVVESLLLQGFKSM